MPRLIERRRPETSDQLPARDRPSRGLIGDLVAGFLDDGTDVFGAGLPFDFDGLGLDVDPHGLDALELGNVGFDGLFAVVAADARNGILVNAHRAHPTHPRWGRQVHPRWGSLASMKETYRRSVI